MRISTPVLGLTFFAFLSSPANASLLWSQCESVIGVNDNRALNGGVDLALSPTLTCTAGWGSEIGFITGTDGVTSDSIKGNLAVVVAALISGKTATFYYDNATCAIQIVALGGYNGQCP